MAIQRLAKDLRTVPMFQKLSTEELAKLKARIIEDILRPLREPHLLKDMVVNCYLIARQMEGLQAEELNRTPHPPFPHGHPASHLGVRVRGNESTQGRAGQKAGFVAPGPPERDQAHFKVHFRASPARGDRGRRGLPGEPFFPGSAALRGTAQVGARPDQHAPAGPGFPSRIPPTTRPSSPKAASPKTTSSSSASFRRILPEILDNRDYPNLFFLCQALHDARKRNPQQLARLRGEITDEIEYVWTGRYAELKEKFLTRKRRPGPAWTRW